ncbi:MAG TPA: alpha/beta hydrolase [Candidatus Hydrogenedentes bacterium]|nr:alpha/beta hydrolase [Candidatus Hydrogenedentota bacterium]
MGSCRLKKFLPLALVFAVSLAGAVWTDETTSKNSVRLERALKRFPNADANGDGILTLEEAREYRKRVQVERRARQRPDAPLIAGAVKHADLRYGPHARNVLDLYLPKDAAKPMPLVVFIHGGGFIDGDKGNVSPIILNQCLRRGAAVAAINYRFITTDPFPASLHDAARAVQYLRHNAAKHQIDPKRFAAFGGSAGGGTSLWLALHDDLADPSSDDPVARASSRLVCAGAIAGQTTYDPRELKEWLGDIVLQHRSVLPLYGAKDLDELLQPTPDRAKLFQECSPIHHVSADDPPLILFYRGETTPDVGGAIHSKVFGERLKAALDAVGVLIVLRADMDKTDDAAVAKELVAFLAKHLGVAATPRKPAPKRE